MQASLRKRSVAHKLAQLSVSTSPPPTLKLGTLVLNEKPSALNTSSSKVDDAQQLNEPPMLESLKL